MTRVLAVAIAILWILPASAEDGNWGNWQKYHPSNCFPASIQAAIAKVRAVCGDAKIISGFRANATIRGSGRPSYHASCRAADFTTSNYSCALSVLSDWNGGLSTDPFLARHIHIDTGPRIRFAHRGGYSKRASR